MLQPGADVVESQGGLHNFMHWNGPLFTDSGGFQIFSLGHGGVEKELKKKGFFSSNNYVKITPEGAVFRSHINGKTYRLTPEISIDIQKKLGADCVFVLDECTPYHVSPEYTRKSMELSHGWAKRSLKRFLESDTPQALYGIVQGGVYPELRKESAHFINDAPFFGQGIGGSLGRCPEEMYRTVALTMNYVAKNRPTHLLGIGRIQDIFQGVKEGVDTFDCVYPTRLGRHGGAYIKPLVYWKTAHEPFHTRHIIDLGKACFATDSTPLDETCPCFTCCTYSRAYLHHLIKAKETNSGTLLTIHNVTHMNRLMAHIRKGLLEEASEEALEKVPKIAPLPPRPSSLENTPKTPNNRLAAIEKEWTSCR